VNDDCAERLSINREDIANNLEKLQNSKDLIERVARLLSEQKKAFQASFIPDISDPDTMLYDGFVPDADRAEARRVGKLGLAAITGYSPDFEDARLNALFPLYKARNFPGSLNENERQIWEEHVARRLFEGSPNALEKFYKRLGELFLRDNLNTNQQYLLQELKLYAESITPAD
jgi:exodeoxyribonuclease-1